jgi:peptidoglycan/xylan/chitin deacetylase (PgdA/CDA1 family)
VSEPTETFYFESCEPRKTLTLKEMKLSRKSGALVISLDFELSWGVRDTHPIGSGYDRNLLGARSAVPKLLDIFSEFDVATTWATVGFLFAQCRDELFAFAPPAEARPRYKDARLNPYSDQIGNDERSSPLQFAHSLIQLIASCPRQEIGTHTFSHFYCLEDGQDESHFRVDLAAALNIAAAQGIELSSIVFPRNQHNPNYDQALRELGIQCYRGNCTGALFRATPTGHQTLARRACRLADSYLPLTGSGAFDWNFESEAEAPLNIRASRFLRPPSGTSRWAERLQLTRITDGMRDAAARGALYHLWWHPHNFGAEPHLCFTYLRNILNQYRELRELFGFESMSMGEVVRCASTQAGVIACQT